MIPMGALNPSGAAPTWNRVDTGIEHLYMFDDGSGTTITDSGGSGSPADLIIPDLGAVSWIGGGGLEITSTARIETAAAMANFTTVVDASEEFTMEAWITPANLTQNGPARVAIISQDSGARNCMIGQGEAGGSAERYEVRMAGIEGAGILRSAIGSLTLAQTHVVLTLLSGTGLEYIYIDGVESNTLAMSDVYAWGDTYKLGIGEEAGGTGARQWLGKYHMLALYSKGLTAAEVTQNFNAGPKGIS